MCGLVHCWSLLLVKETDKLFLRLHCQGDSPGAITRLMIGWNGRYGSVPGIKGMIERWTRTQHMDK